MRWKKSRSLKAELVGLFVSSWVTGPFMGEKRVIGGLRAFARNPIKGEVSVPEFCAGIIERNRGVDALNGFRRKIMWVEGALSWVNF